MGRIGEIFERIEELFEGGVVKKGRGIKVVNLPENSEILLRACFAGKKGYKISEKDGDVVIDAEDSQREVTGLYIQYGD